MRASVLPVLLLAGCAVIAEDNRRTLNAMDAHLAPESPGARWAVVPIALPAGLLGLCVDAAVVHPAASVDDAWGDTVELLWTPDEETAFRRTVMTPLVAIATPLVFAGDWLGRALFPIDARDDAEGGR